MKSKWWLIAFILCLIIATLSPLTSSAPDGLEKVAQDEGFSALAKDSPFEIIADYTFPGVENKALSTILAGWAGTVILFGIFYSVAWLVSHRQKRIT